MADENRYHGRRGRHDNFLNPFSDFDRDMFGMGGFFDMGGFGEMMNRQMSAFDAAFSRMDDFMGGNHTDIPEEQG